MNTQIYLWVEPMVMHHQRSAEKVYFNCIIEGNYTTATIKELEGLIDGSNMYSIMCFADIHSNWDYAVVSATATKNKPTVEYAVSPDKVANDEAEKIANSIKKKEEVRIQKTINSKKPLILTKDNVIIKDAGKIGITVPSLNVNQEIDFAKIWSTLEKEVIGKIQEGDEVTLTDDDGNVLFELRGGGFLNVGLADMSIYDTKTMDKKRSIFNHMKGLKGGLFVREDGSIDVGDAKRTFLLKIYVNKLLKASLKANKSLNELTDIKLLNK